MAFLPAMERVILINIIFLPVLLLLEALIYAVFGSTFGRWVFQTQVVDANNRKVTAGKYLKRNARLYFSGLGLGIPLVSVITEIFQACRVSGGKESTYDESLGLHVCQSKQRFFHLLVALVSIVLFSSPFWNWTDCGRPPALQTEFSDSVPVSTLKRQATENPFAANALGIRYLNGSDVAKNLREAEACFRSAAQRGVPMAWLNLALVKLEIEGDWTPEAISYMRKASEQGVPQAQEWINQFTQAQEMNYYDSVPLSVLKSEKASNPYAANELGLRYFEGSGITKNLQEAEDNFRNAAQKGLSVAWLNLGLVLAEKEGEWTQEAVTCVQKAAKQGNPEANNLLGVRYHEGSGVTKDLQEAEFCFRTAAHGGVAMAWRNLALVHVEKDGGWTPEAISYMRKASELGVPEAQTMLNSLTQLFGDALGTATLLKTEYPDSVPVSVLRSEAPLNPFAANALGFRYFKGSGISKNLKEAEANFRNAAQKGLSVAWLNLALVLAEKEGGWSHEAVSCVRKASELNIPMATELLRQLKQQFGSALDTAPFLQTTFPNSVPISVLKKESTTNPFAANALGIRCMEGFGIEKNILEAETCFRRAAQHGVPLAWLNLAFVLVEKDGEWTTESVSCVRKAAELDIAEAKELLEQLAE